MLFFSCVKRDIGANDDVELRVVDERRLAGKELLLLGVWGGRLKAVGDISRRSGRSNERALGAIIIAATGVCLRAKKMRWSSVRVG